jgi:hypothetical protein
MSVTTADPVGFVVAMRARLERAGADPRREWLIVSRWGADGRYLSLSCCAAPAPDGGLAPLGLAPRSTALGVLLQWPMARTPCFLLVRRLPPGMVLAGRFVPMDGYVRLGERAGGLHLMAEGRHARPRAAGAWRLRGIRAPWSGEFFDAGAPPGEAAPASAMRA